MSTTLALLHPGDMGAAIGACLVAQGHRVVWVATGRSPETRARAEAAGLEPAASLAQALAAVHVVISVCPPHGALTLAEQVASYGFRGVYLDANAVAPDTARRIGLALGAGGHVRYVDGGIIGPPPHRPETTRLYLAGEAAREVAALFGPGALQAIALNGEPGTASALKMCYAAYTKGLTALLANIRALASHEGVAADLLAEWQRSLPDVTGRSQAIESQARKAWRWHGEMDEIARTFQQAGLPGGFHEAAAEIYRRLEAFKDIPPPAALADIEAALLAGAKTAGSS
ncbi:MAG: DUF1932 domain-containing protein [Pigmentiphaga sp.]